MNFPADPDGIQTIKLENEWIRASVLPDIGAKIFDMVLKSNNCNFLWHNSKIAPRWFPVDAIFDDHWCGGWDDGFPTCDPCEFRGKRYPGLGELRSLQWEFTQPDRMRVELWTTGPISPIEARKVVRLSPRAPVLSVRFEVKNLGQVPLDFMWGTHPAIRPFGRNLKLLIPAQSGVVVEGPHGPNYGPGHRFQWPMLGDEDVSRIGAADAGSYSGIGVMDLDAGWYGIEDLDTGKGIVVAFPKDLCPYLWLWLNYGGYLGYHHVIVEPWTSFPMTLAAAAGAGTSRQLASGETFCVEIFATLYEGPETHEDGLARIAESRVQLLS